MKKFASIALALVLSMSAAALAADKGDKNAKNTSQGFPQDPVTAVNFSASDTEDAALTRCEVKSFHAYGVYDENHQVTTYRVEFAVLDRESFETTVHSYVISLPSGEVASSTAAVRSYH